MKNIITAPARFVRRHSLALTLASIGVTTLVLAATKSSNEVYTNFIAENGLTEAFEQATKEL
jgi:hypothetical protein